MPEFGVMSWNVENLFQPGDVVSRLPRRLMARPAYEGKLDHLARVVGEVAPDVVALQELGGSGAAVRATLADLNDRLGNAYPHAEVSGHADGRNIRVAFLSKHPTGNAEDVVRFADGELSAVADWRSRGRADTLSRGALVVEVAPASGARVRLVTLHLKSKLVTYNRPNGGTPFAPDDEDERAIGAGLALLRRTAEAVAVRVRLNALMPADPGVHTVVLGDLNDEPRAATSQILGGPVDRDVTRDDTGDPARLYNLMAPLPMRGGPDEDVWLLEGHERFTRVFEGRGELIDHVYASRGLLGDPAKLGTPGADVRVRSLVAGISGQSVGTDAAARLGEQVPDHAPVCATFRL